MKEKRINELASLAGANIPGVLGRDAGHAAVGFQTKESFEKFAELLIKDICENVVQPYMSRWPEDCVLVTNIKQHYGVKS